jgi:hypothetical protein
MKSQKSKKSSEGVALAKYDAQATAALATIDTMTQAIAQVTDFKEAKVAISTSKAFQLYVKEYKLGREALLRGAEAQLRAELRAGTVAIEMAKSPEYGQMIADARLEHGQVSRWRRESENIGVDAFSLDPKIIDSELDKLIPKYVQSVREDTTGAVPTFRGFLFWKNSGGRHEENSKEARTELTKQFCQFYSFDRAQDEVNLWLADSGRSAEEKKEIETMWAKIIAEGRLFEGQKAREE